MYTCSKCGTEFDNESSMTMHEKFCQGSQVDTSTLAEARSKKRKKTAFDPLDHSPPTQRPPSGSPQVATMRRHSPSVGYSPHASSTGTESTSDADRSESSRSFSTTHPGPSSLRDQRTTGRKRRSRDRDDYPSDMMPTGMQIIMWLDFILGAALLISGIVFVLKGPVVGALIIAAVGVLVFLLGRGLGTGSTFARVIHIIVLSIGALNIPIGTMICGMLLSSLFSQEGTDWCSGTTRKRPSFNIVVAFFGLGVIAAYAIPTLLVLSMVNPGFKAVINKALEKPEVIQCRSHLKMLKESVVLWEEEHYAPKGITGGIIVDTEGDPGPVGKELEPLLVPSLAPEFPRCPEGGIYSYDQETRSVSCSRHEAATSD